MRVRGDDRECIETALRTGRTRPVFQGLSVFRALCGGEPLVDRIVAVRRGRLAELAAFSPVRMCRESLSPLPFLKTLPISMLPEVVVDFQYGTSLVSRYWYTSGCSKLPFCRLFSAETVATSEAAETSVPSAESTPTRGIRGDTKSKNQGTGDHEREHASLGFPGLHVLSSMGTGW